MAEPKTEPVIRAIRVAYRASKQYQLDRLLMEETRWKRKATIAQNKLAWVRARINEFAQAMVKPPAEPKA